MITCVNLYAPECAHARWQKEKKLLKLTNATSVHFLKLSSEISVLFINKYACVMCVCRRAFCFGVCEVCVSPCFVLLLFFFCVFVSVCVCVYFFCTCVCVRLCFLMHHHIVLAWWRQFRFHINFSKEFFGISKIFVWTAGVI